MIVPKELKEIFGQKKRRDLLICNTYLEGTPTIEIADRFNLTQRRVEIIIKNNAEYINKHIGWDKSKRLHKLIQVANSCGVRLSNGKDILNVIESMRKELEGDTALVDNSTHITRVDRVEVIISDEVEIPLTQGAGRGIQEQSPI